MLKDVLSKRFTAKWWDSRPVEQEKINDIVECAYLAPSKNGKHNHQIYVISDSPTGKKFKDFLYYENAWCVGERRAPAGYVGGNKRFNGQVHAPVVLLWVGKVPGWRTPDLQGEDDKQRVRDDCLVSATIAMCAAEELGLQTGFNGMIGPVEISQYLKLDTNVDYPIMAIGIGYATPAGTANRPVLAQEHRTVRHPNNDPKLFPNAYNLLHNNITFLQREAAAWVHRKQTGTTPDPDFSTPYRIQLCSRDIRYVVNAFLQDLQLGTNTATRTIMSNYWDKGVLRVVSQYEKEVHAYLKNIIVNYILKNQAFPALQQTASQVFDLNKPSEFEAIDFMDNLTNIFLKGFDGEGLIPQIGFDLNNVDPENRTTYNRKNRPSKAAMIKYI